MHKESIALLNQAVAEELSSVHQYMYFHFHCDDQGFSMLANLFRRIAIQEMMHIETLAERILFLKGDVDMVASIPVKKETDVTKMLEMAREMENQSAKDYNRFAQECAKNADSATKSIFESLVTQEEGHYDLYDKEGGGHDSVFFIASFIQN